MKQLMDVAGNDCQASYGGYLKLDHNLKAQQTLRSQLEYMQTKFGDESKWLTNEMVQRNYIATELNYGAQLVPYCFAIDPLKLVQSYAQLADKNGVLRYQKTPMVSYESKGNTHTVFTPKGKIS